MIAATGADRPAYAGRLTRAATTVIHRITSGELDLAPTVRAVGFDVLFERIRKEVRALAVAEDGHSQDPMATPVMGAQPELPFFLNPRYQPNPAAKAAAAVKPATAPSPTRPWMRSISAIARATAARPSENPEFAAVHARQRALPVILRSLTTQLHFDPDLADGELTPAGVIDAIAQRARPPVVVIDAVDEAPITNGSSASCSFRWPAPVAVTVRRRAGFWSGCDRGGRSGHCWIWHTASGR